MIYPRLGELVRALRHHACVDVVLITKTDEPCIRGFLGFLGFDTRYDNECNYEDHREYSIGPGTCRRDRRG